MGLMKKLTSAVVASSLVLGLVGTAAADYSPAGVTAASARMQALNVVKGVLQPDGSTDMMLGKNITRAELVTIIVRAFGQAETAKIVKGYPAFSDSGDHWASGEIAVAKNIIESKGHTLGVTATTFVPNKDVNAAEAIAFLMKFLGIKEDTTKSWPNNFIEGAVKAGLITEADKTALTVSPLTPATRGLVFYFADQAFASYKLENGKSVYTTYVDTMAPVVTVDSYEATTTATKVTLSGTAQGQSVLHVGSTSNVVAVGADGKWSTTVELALGENDVWVHALDAAGNAGVPASAVKITRTAGAAATIEATVPATVVAGGSFELVAKAFDANKAEIAGAEFAVTVEGNIGTFDAATNKFTAADAVATGKLTIKSGEATQVVDVAVVAGALAKVEASAASAKIGEQVTLTAKDAKGNTVTGATFTQSSADALLDSSKGVFVASKAGNYTITATKDGQTATATVGVYSSAVAKVVVSAPATVVGNSDDAGSTDGQQDSTDVVGSTYEVTVKAVDANGNLVASYDRDIVLTLPAGFFAATDTDDTIATNGTTGVTTITKEAVNGSATFKVLASYLNVGRSYQFGATTTLADATVIGDASTEITKATTEITEQVATSVKVSTSSTAKYLRANDSTDFTTVGVYVADQNGKRFLESTGYTVNLSVAGPATIAVDSVTGKTSTTTTYSGATKTVTLESITGRTGNVTLTAAVDGLGQATASVTAAIAEDAAKVAVTADKTSAVAADVDTVTYTIQVTDANGVPVAEAVSLKGIFNVEDTDGNLTLAAVSPAVGTVGALTVDADNDVTYSLITTDSNGKAKFTLKAYEYVGDLELTVKDNDGAFAVAQGTAAVKFSADKAATFGLTRTDDINVGSVAPNTQLAVQLYDAAGNKAAVAGKKITFASAADVKFNGTAEELEVTTDANGVATVDVSVLGYVNNSYTITVTGETGLSAVTGEDTIGVNVVNAVASTLSYTLKDGNGATVTRVTAGEPITLTVTAKDAAGKAVTNDAIYFVPSATVYSNAAYTTTISKTNGVVVPEGGTVDGVYSIVVYPATSGTLTFTLKDKTSSATLEQAGSMRVVAAAANKLVVNGGDDIKLSEGVASGAVTVKLADRFGNAVPTSSAMDISITDSNGVGIRTSVNAANVAKLTIPTGQSSTTFFLWNSLDAGTYSVTFDAPAGITDATVNVVVE